MSGHDLVTSLNHDTYIWMVVFGYGFKNREQTPQKNKKNAHVYTLTYCWKTQVTNFWGFHVSLHMLIMINLWRFLVIIREYNIASSSQFFCIGDNSLVVCVWYMALVGCPHCPWGTLSKDTMHSFIVQYIILWFILNTFKEYIILFRFKFKTWPLRFCHGHMVKTTHPHWQQCEIWFYNDLGLFVCFFVYRD